MGQYTVVPAQTYLDIQDIWLFPKRGDPKSGVSSVSLNNIITLMFGFTSVGKTIMNQLVGDGLYHIL